MFTSQSKTAVNLLALAFSLVLALPQMALADEPAEEAGEAQYEPSAEEKAYYEKLRKLNWVTGAKTVDVVGDSHVVVDITLVFDDDMQSEALSLPARVAWCTTLDDEFQIGVSFKPLDADRAEYLQLFLKYLGEERAPRGRRTEKNIDDRFG